MEEAEEFPEKDVEKVIQMLKGRNQASVQHTQHEKGP